MIPMISLSLALAVGLFGASNAFCPRGCTCVNYPEPEAICHNTGLTHIPIMLNPRLKKLVLRANSITEIKLDQLSLYTDLEILDLSENGIFSIELGAFYKLSKLKVLKLNSNMLASLQVDLFVGLHNLRLLDLSENGLSRVPTSAFSDMRQLELLNLSRNTISNISPGAFTGLGSLKELYLQENEVSALPSIALRPLTQVRILTFSQNLIKFVLEDTFAQMRQLEVLNLSRNDIETVEEGAFSGLGNLQSLDLSSNSLFRVPTLSFRPLVELAKLSLNENLFLELETSSFEGLAKLSQLFISQCPNLNSVNLNAFSGLYQLEALWLSENPELKFIHPMAFESGQSLHQLFIFRNQLSTLPKSLLKWENLEILDLRYNPWDCNCDLVWLIEYLQVHPNFPHGAVCHLPSTVEGISLTSLNSGSISCKDGNTESLVLTAAIVATILICITLISAISWILRFKVGDLFHKFFLHSTRSSSQSNLYKSVPPSSTYAPDYSTYYTEEGKSQYSRGSKTPCFYYTDTLVPCLEGKGSEDSGFLDGSGYYSSASLLYGKAGTLSEPHGKVPFRSIAPSTGTLPTTHVLSKQDSFKVVTEYPVPITEL